jgi:hypothetical protein
MKAAITASGASLVYQNLGSGPAEESMLAGSQSIGPMSRNFRESTLIAYPTWTPAVKNVIGLDAVVVVVKNGQQRCKNLSLPTDPNDPKSAQENNLLQLVLGGEGTTLACADPARLQAVVDFTNCFVGLDRVEHFYRPDDRSGTAELIKQKLKIKRFCNGAAPGPTNLDAADNDPIRYPCVPADDTRAVTKCSDPSGNPCTAGTEGCTQGLVVALSEADPNTSDVTVSLSRRVKNDSASVAFAGRQAVKQPQSPTNGVNINTISYAPQNIRLDQYMFSRRLYLMKADPTSDPDRNLQVELFYDWATNPDNEVPGRCNMDPLMIQYGYVPCTDDCSPPTGANTLCVKTPFQPAPEPVAACVPALNVCMTGVDMCCDGSVCSMGICMSDSVRAEGFACSDSTQCASPLSCLQGDWPVTTCGLAAGGIWGTITLNGTGLGGVTISAGGSSTTADSSGNYTLVGLASGEYIVTPSFSGYTFDPPQATIMVQDAIVTGVDFTAIIVPMYEISGTVTSDWVGYPNYCFFISGNQPYFTCTDSLGYYNVMVPDGVYTIQAWAPMGCTVDPTMRTVTVDGADMPGQNFALTCVPSYTISGTVTFNDAGLGNVSLELISSDGATEGRMTAGPTGNFQFENVRDGDYVITGKLCAYSITPLPVTVSGGDVTGLFMIAASAPNYTVSGHVTSNGVGVPSIQMMLLKSDGNGPSAVTQGDGSYLLDCLDPGTYTLTPSNYPWEIQYGFSPPSAEVVLTVPNPSVTQDFTATPP